MAILSSDEVFGKVTNVKIIVPIQFKHTLWLRTSITVVEFSNSLHYHFEDGDITNDPFICYEGITDILTMYSILKTRIGCNNILPNFAKKETYRYFNHLVESLQTGDIYDLMTLYSYLSSHIEILDLNITRVPKFRLELTDQIANSNLVIIEKQIPILIDSISQYINLLS